MSKIVHIVFLLLEFMWSNRYLMGALTPLQRKMFFLPFIAVDAKHCRCGQEVHIPLLFARAFLGTKSNDKHLAQALKKGYDAITKGYSDDTAFLPYEYKGVKNGAAVFKLVDCRIFSGFASELACQINLDEVSEYESGHNIDNGTLPLLWYLLCVVNRFLTDFDAAVVDKSMPIGEFVYSDDGEPLALLITIGFEELKQIYGYGKYDYVNIPKGNRERFLAIEKALPLKYKLQGLERMLGKEGLTEKKKSGIEASITRVVESINEVEDQYGGTIDTLEQEYYLIRRKIQPLRQPFIDRVVIPGIEELNSGSMLNFNPLEKWKRPAKRTKAEIEANAPIKNAEKVTVWVRPNYEMLPPGQCAIKDPILDRHGQIIGGDIIFKNITNYRLSKKAKNLRCA